MLLGACWLGCLLIGSSQCRYVRYFAASLVQLPRQHRVCLKAVSIGGLNWLGSGRRTDIKVRCRPTGAAEAGKVARIHLDAKRQGSCKDCWLEGDLRFEVSCDSNELRASPGLTPHLILPATAETRRDMAALKATLLLDFQILVCCSLCHRAVEAHFGCCKHASALGNPLICRSRSWRLIACWSWPSISLQHTFACAQVLRVRDKRPARMLFSIWLHSAYIEVPIVQLNRSDLDKVGRQTPA